MKNTMQKTTTAEYPDIKGHFGIYGGRYVPETVIPALDELEEKMGKRRIIAEICIQ